MAGQEPLRITCEDCPGGSGCDDCLVGFFLSARDAQVLRFGQAGQSTAVAAVPELDPDLTLALQALVAGGLQPQVLATRRSAVPRAS